jgi:hypothetical protein
LRSALWHTHTHSNYLFDSALIFGFARVDVRSNLDQLGGLRYVFGQNLGLDGR